MIDCTLPLKQVSTAYSPATFLQIIADLGFPQNPGIITQWNFQQDKDGQKKKDAKRKNHHLFKKTPAPTIFTGNYWSTTNH